MLQRLRASGVHGQPPDSRPASAAAQRLALRSGIRELAIRLQEFALAAGGLVLVTLVLHSYQGRLNTVVVALAYLTTVLVCAVRASTWVAITIAALAFIAFDVLFIPPYGSLTVSSSADGVALLSFGVVSLVTIESVSLLRRQTEGAEARAGVARALSAFSALLLAQAGGERLRPSVLREAAELLDAQECAVLPVHDNRVLIDGLGSTQALPLPEYADADQAQSVVTTCKPLVLDLKAHATIAPGAPDRRLYLPLAADNQMLGILVARGPLRGCRPGTGPVPPTVTAVGQTLAIALDRARLSLEAARLEGLRQSEEFKGILLAAISHELKTPIAAVKATVSGLLGVGARWDESGLQSGLHAIEESTDRLDRLVTNLLDLSRIEAGAVHLHPDWCDLNDLVSSAVAATGHVLDERQLTFEIPDDMPPIHVDFVLIVQILMNLLDNAAKYTLPGGHIDVSARAGHGGTIVSVSDDGPGIAPESRPHVFEKFYRVSHPAVGRSPGAGLGLAICRGLVEKHGGTIEVTDSTMGGATVSFTLPNSPKTPEYGRPDP